MRLGADDDRLTQHLRTAFPTAFPTGLPDRVGVAVSGGGDSVALLYLLADFAKGQGVTLQVATVDHGLRPEAAEEAAFVASLCAGLGVQHATLTWDGWDNFGNLQAKARQARYDLLAGWAQSAGISCVALGHTADDVAETFLMRLARGAGLKGLAQMAGQFTTDGTQFNRPLLGVSRTDLRDFLTRHDISWRDDPSNEDTRFGRVRARKALQHLAPIGIDAAGLAGVSRKLRDAEDILALAATEAARQVVHFDRGDVLLDIAALRNTPPELQRRLLTGALMAVSSAAYSPRSQSVTDVLKAALDGQQATLSGCHITAEDIQIRVTREHEAVKNTSAAPGALWDGRWSVDGPTQGGETIRALGEAGLRFCPDWRLSGLPRRSLLASPAAWRAGDLIAAPLAQFANGWTAILACDEKLCYSRTLSH